MVRKIVGWGKRYVGPRPTQPFTKKEFEGSHVRKNLKIRSYREYLDDFADIQKKRVKRKVVRRIRPKLSIRSLI